MSDDTDQGAERPKLRCPATPYEYRLLVPIERKRNGVPDGFIDTITIKRRPRFKDAKKIARCSDPFDRLACFLKQCSDMVLESVIDELDIADINALNELITPFFATSDDEGSDDETLTDTSASASAA